MTRPNSPRDLEPCVVPTDAPPHPPAAANPTPPTAPANRTFDRATTLLKPSRRPAASS